MFGWRLSQLGLVFFVICVNKAFNATWLINDSSRLKDKEGLASWSSTGGGELNSVSSGVRNEESRASRGTGGSSRLEDKEDWTSWNPAGFKKFRIDSYRNRGPQQDYQKTGRLKAEGKQDVPKVSEGHQGDENHGNQIYYESMPKTIARYETKGKGNPPRGRRLLWNRLHYINKRTLARKRVHESHSGILVEQESIFSGEAEAYKTVLTEKKNEIPISPFILQAADTNSNENIAGLSDYTQTQTTVKSTLSMRANRDSGGQGDGEKASVTAKPASLVTSALESFPSLEGMKRRESTKSWEIIGVSGVVTPKVKVDFKVIFPKEKCCPGLVLGPTTMLAKTRLHTCFNMSLYYETTFQEISTMIFQLEPNKTATYCQLKGDFYHCHGTMHGHGSYSDTWQVAVFNRCDQKNVTSLDVSYELTFHEGDEPECQELDKLSKDCIEYAKIVRIPNIFGAKDQSDARDMSNMVRKVLESGCHQHAAEFGCRSIFAECLPNDKVMFPCRSMCEEVMRACSDKFGKIPVPDCTFYPDNKMPCFKKEVKCPVPKNVQCGQVRYEGKRSAGDVAVYTCNFFFQLPAGDNGIRKCDLTGKWSPTSNWSGTDPVCVTVFTTVTYVCIVLATFTVFILIGVIVAIRYKHEIMVLLYSRWGISFLRRDCEDESKKFDAFVLYNRHDYAFVIQEMLPRLESVNSNFKLHIHERDFEIGDYISRNIIKAVESSRRAIVVLSDSFIRGHWGEFEFELVSQKEIENKNFKVIIILMQDPQSFHNVPEQIRAYMRIGRCIRKNDKMFWERLVYEMPHRRSDGVMRQQSEEDSDPGYSSASSLLMSSCNNYDEGVDIPDDCPLTLPTNPSLYRQLVQYFRQYFGTPQVEAGEETQEETISFIMEG